VTEAWALQGSRHPVSETSEPFTPASAAAHLLGLLVQSPDMHAFLDKIAHLAGETITPAAACGITVRRDGGPFSAAVSNELAGQVDEIQYGADQGPCLDALRTGTIVQVDNLNDERRWNEYRPHAIAHGITSSLSVPLILDGERLGALNLYSDIRAAFTGPPREQAETFAGQCAAALTVTCGRPVKPSSKPSWPRPWFPAASSTRPSAS
jgi:GAF domain-containing protein